MNQDTICALATANGVGAIGIIRISGERSFEIANKVFEGKNIEKVSLILFTTGLSKKMRKLLMR